MWIKCCVWDGCGYDMINIDLYDNYDYFRYLFEFFEFVKSIVLISQVLDNKPINSPIPGRCY